MSLDQTRKLKTSIETGAFPATEVKELLRKGADARDSLPFAFQEGHLDSGVLKLLLEAVTCDDLASFKDGDGNTVVTLAGIGLLDAVPLVVERVGRSKVDLDLDAYGSNDFEKSNPLHLAAGACHLAAVEALVTAGANVDAQDTNGAKPLSYAQDAGCPDKPNWDKIKSYLQGN